MATVKIKLCGVRRPADALLCAAAGADEVGVVFATGSKRRVTLDVARQIRDALAPQVPLVGVFLDAAIEDLGAAAATGALSALQLHGRIPAGCEELGLPLYAALQVTSPEALAPLGALSPRFTRALLDGPRGGSGLPFAWELGRAARARFGGQLFVAGGLHAGNVAQAIAAAAPDGVDVASGVEGEDGFKDAARVEAFVAAVRGAGRGY